MQKHRQHCTAAVMGLLGGMILLVGSSGLSYANHFPAENVSMTKHNLSANTNIQFGSTTNGSSEVCVFCHTPHGAGYAVATAGQGGLAAGVPPLWNRKLDLSTVYNTYDQAGSPHFESSSATSLGGVIKGVSLACLSCHDGTIAFDALINLQGSGGYQPLNAAQGAGPGDTSVSSALFGAFGAEGSTVQNRHFNGNPRPTEGLGNPFGGSLFSNDTLGGPGTSPFPNLTTDLRDDHPISFQIPTSDPQFTEVIFGSEADPNNKLLYLKRAVTAITNGAKPQDKRDRIRAYASDGGTVTTSTNNSAYIECASCHNPHTPRTLFLRLPSNVDNTGAFVDPGTAGTGLPSGAGALLAPASLGASATYWSHAPNQASAICLSCHQK